MPNLLEIQVVIWILWQFYKGEIYQYFFVCSFVCFESSPESPQLHSPSFSASQVLRLQACTFVSDFYYKNMLVVAQMRHLHKSQTFEYLDQLVSIWRGWRGLAGGNMPLGVGFEGSEDSHVFEFVLYASCLRCEPSSAAPADMPASYCYAASSWWTLMPLEQ